MTRRSLLDLFAVVARPFYDRMYRRGAPWESGPRGELVTLVEDGLVSSVSPGPRAIDLGCGSGADSVFLAGHGFDVVGVDLSPVAIEKARVAALEAGVTPRFVVGDLLGLPAELRGPYDLLFDGGTIDDFPRRTRERVAGVVTDLARPGSVLVLWCFYARDPDLPLFALDGPSRLGAPGIEPDELVRLFGDAWDIDRVAGGEGVRQACFLLTRRTDRPPA